MITEIHGLRVDSFIDLPFFALSSCNEADVCIISKKTPERIDDPLETTPFYQVSEKEFLLRIPGIADYYVRDGCVIWINARESVSEDDITLFLMDSVFSVLLHQKGLLSFRGVAVEKNGNAFLFIGSAGIGKSALADELVRRGCSLISDGHVVTDGKFVFPGRKALGLWQDMVKAGGHDPAHLKRVRPALNKYWVDYSAHPSLKVPVAGIFTLQEYGKTGVEIQNVKGSVKLKMLWEYTSWRHLADIMACKKRHFLFFAGLSQKTPMKQILFSHGFNETADARQLADYIEKYGAL